MKLDWLPRYFIGEEIQRDELRGRIGMKAWEFKKRLDGGKNSKLVRCY